MRSRKITRGFTIVELLIVISVITILAAIVIVSYGSVQNNSRDTAVQSDLRNIADRLEEFRLTNNRYPQATQAELQGLIRVTKSAYLSNVAAGTMSYCRNDNDFTLYARSVSMNVFRFSSKSGLQQNVAWTGNLNDPNPALGQCASGGVLPSDSGYGSIWLLKGTGNPAGAGWESWVIGN